MAGRFGRQGVITSERQASMINVEESDSDHEDNKSGDADKNGVVDVAPLANTKKNEAPANGTGCLACSRDDDHSNLILCDRCNDEYHIYCLDPPLSSVPGGDWFCDGCRPVIDTHEDDGLDRLVSALPPAFTSRFGEIVWAAGGTGFGWWPACIYDPTLTVGSARELARKNLGKKHLVYFFECHEAPFSVMVSSRLTNWEEGIAEDYHLGRAAKAAGKNRSQQFDHALQAAILENGKPVEMRLEWNHPQLPQSMPSPQKKRKSRSHRHGLLHTEKRERKQARQAGSEKVGEKRVRVKGKKLAHVIPNRTNLNSAIAALKANHIESSEDGELYLKILKKNPVSEEVESVGFVKLESRLSATFADARVVIEDEIDNDCLSQESHWKFYVPNLGPVGAKQEAKVGPILHFLRDTTSDPRLGNGSIRSPLKVFIVPVYRSRESMGSTSTPASL